MFFSSLLVDKASTCVRTIRALLLNAVLLAVLSILFPRVCVFQDVHDYGADQQQHVRSSMAFAIQELLGVRNFTHSFLLGDGFTLERNN